MLWLSVVASIFTRVAALLLSIVAKESGAGKLVQPAI